MASSICLSRMAAVVGQGLPSTIPTRRSWAAGTLMSSPMLAHSKETGRESGARVKRTTTARRLLAVETSELRAELAETATQESQQPCSQDRASAGDSPLLYTLAVCHHLPPRHPSPKSPRSGWTRKAHGPPPLHNGTRQNGPYMHQKPCETTRKHLEIASVLPRKLDYPVLPSRQSLLGTADRQSWKCFPDLACNARPQFPRRRS